MSDNLQEVIFDELNRALEPLRRAATDVDELLLLFAAVGWDLSAVAGVQLAQVQGALAGLAQGYDQFSRYADDPPDSLAEIRQALPAATKAFKQVAGLRNLISMPAPPPNFAEIGQDIAEHLVVAYLYQHHTALWNLLVVLTLAADADEFAPVVPRVVDAATGKTLRHAHRRQRLRPKQLPKLLRDPVRTLGEEYLPPSGKLRTQADVHEMARKLFGRLARLLDSIGVQALYGFDPGPGVDLGQAGNAIARDMLTVAYSPELLADAETTVGATFSLAPSSEGDPDLVVVPFGNLRLTRAVGGWAFSLNMPVRLDAFAVGKRGLALPWNVGGGPQPGGGGGASVAVTLALAKLGAGDGPAFVLGSTEQVEGEYTGTRLEIGQFRVTAEGSFSREAQEVGFLVEASEAAFVLAPGDGDGFLQKILPKEGLRAEFDLAAGWSNRKGLYFKGSAGLEATLPVKASLLGVLDIESIYVAVRAESDERVRAFVAISARVKLGPITAVVERVGLEASFGLPGASEAAGGSGLALAFKPPSGAGLTVDAGVVVGGGYLFFDAANEQYAGVLQLELGGKVSLGAIGLLTTRLPGGRKGFSLLVIIAAEFPPIPLGFGFTLNGVGGLIGVNRTAKTDVLRAGIKTGTLNSVLFPPDPAQNALEIISNLGAVFPPAENRFLVGPMAKIGWGTPTILTIELGLILELPAPVRLIILGRLRAVLPSEEKPLVRLQMDALGIIDFDRREVSLDATLYDSRLLEFVLTGDMALRASWGDKPNFVLAIGGFNPRFKAPPNFPKLERVALSLQSSEKLRLRLETYLALTSNTAQFGARLDLHVSAGSFTVDGYLAFDALFHFSPFHFIVDIGAMVALKYKSHNLVGIRLDVTLSGPTPWHVRGKATFEVLGFDVTVEFDRRFGREELPPPPPRAEVRPLLLEALRDARNWSGQLEEHPFVTLRDRGQDGANDFLVHPLSSLTVRQRVVPLAQKITRFGNAVPSDADFFALDVLRADGSPLSDERARFAPVSDFFAPAQFEEMTDARKLSSPSFRLMQSGVSFEVAEVFYSYDPRLDVDIEFETVVYNATINPGLQRYEEPTRKALDAPRGLSAQMLDTESETGAAAQAPIRTTGAERYRAG